MITRFDKIYGCFILLLLSCFIVSNAIAADKIGAVAAVIGTVSIERNGEVVKVKPGSAVFENDKILTGKSSRAQSTFDGPNGYQYRSESRTRSR